MLKTAPLACDKKQPEVRGQTRSTGPTHRQKRWLSRRKAVKTRSRIHKRVLAWFAGRRCKRQPKRAERPHSIIQRPQGVGRPCYEAENSACRGKWRREAGSPGRVRLMPAWERESGELPAPNLPPSGRKAGRGLFVSFAGDSGHGIWGLHTAIQRSHAFRGSCFTSERIHGWETRSLLSVNPCNP